MKLHQKTKTVMLMNDGGCKIQSSDAQLLTVKKSTI